jgi:hypothetical protein
MAMMIYHQQFLLHVNKCHLPEKIDKLRFPQLLKCCELCVASVSLFSGKVMKLWERI